jgi:hypothetical protein
MTTYKINKNNRSVSFPENVLNILAGWQPAHGAALHVDRPREWDAAARGAFQAHEAVPHMLYLLHKWSSRIVANSLPLSPAAVLHQLSSTAAGRTAGRKYVVVFPDNDFKMLSLKGH